MKNQATKVNTHFCGKREPHGWSRVQVEGQAGTVGSSLYSGGDSDEGCVSGDIPAPRYGPETTCEETSAANGDSCISGRDVPEIESVGFWVVQEEDNMKKRERNAKARKHGPILKSKLRVDRASMVIR